jgi:hypothetical protein
MTTIAYDGHTLVVDSMSSADHLMVSRTRQKMWGATGEFLCVVMAGQCSHYTAILNWLKDGAGADGWKDWDAVAWAVTKDKQVLRFTCGYPEEVSGPDADGSGAELALGAMSAGASAFQALEIASKYDLYTGGTINAFEIESKRLLSDL